MQKSRWLKHNKTLCYAHVKPSSDVPGMVTLLRTSLAKKYIYISRLFLSCGPVILWVQGLLGLIVHEVLRFSKISCSVIF